MWEAACSLAACPGAPGLLLLLYWLPLGGPPDQGLACPFWPGFLVLVSFDSLNSLLPFAAPPLTTFTRPGASTAL